MQSTLSGTLYVYQGEEIGQRNMPPEFDPSEYKDVETINYWNKVLNLPLNTTNPPTPQPKTQKPNSIPPR